MKRFLVFSIGVSSVMLSSAQMRVTPSGQVRVGYNVDLVQDDIEPIAPDYYDHNAGLIVVGREGATTNSGYMAFGPGSDVLVGESPLYPNILMMDITSGILFRKGRRTVFKYGQFGNTESATPEKFSFSCDVVSTAFHVASDMRLKKNISTLSGEGASLLDITPVRYNLDNSRIFAARSAEPLDSFDVRLTMPYDTRDRYGFLAQEVMEIYPELVSEDSEGMLAVDYIGFVPLLVDAVKTLNDKIEQQDEIIERQNGIIASLSGATRQRVAAGISVSESGVSAAVLGQNRPNPFNVSSEITCTLPEEVRDAFIAVYDMQGKQLMRLNVGGRGQTEVHVEAASLSPGMYLYSLIADGIEIDSKRMIITD